MNNIKVNYRPPFVPIIVAKSGCSNSNNHNKDSYCEQTFKNILKEKLRNDASPLSDIPPRMFPVLFNKRLVY